MHFGRHSHHTHTFDINSKPMNNKQFYTFIILFLLVCIILISLHQKIDKMGFAFAEQIKQVQLTNKSPVTIMSSVQIEKVVGNGNVFGDNNKIENISVV